LGLQIYEVARNIDDTYNLDDNLSNLPFFKEMTQETGL